MSTIPPSDPPSEGPSKPPSLPPDLPPDVYVAELTWEQVGELVVDVLACAEVRSVAVRGGTGPSRDEPDLQDAIRMLEHGEAAGVQVTYRHDGATWVDTLMRQRDHLRLVRVQREESPSAS